jgi:hypothetical protein
MRLLARSAAPAVATAILMTLINCVHAQQALTKEKIIGTWKLLSFYDESVESGKKTNVFGENPRGYLILTPDERIALINVAASREGPKSLPPTQTEAAALFNSMIAYIGRYKIDPTPTEGGTKIVLPAEIASNPLIEGRDRAFLVRLDGNKLIFKTNPPAPSPLTGEVSTRNVMWERE